MNRTTPGDSLRFEYSDDGIFMQLVEHNDDGEIADAKSPQYALGTQEFESLKNSLEMLETALEHQVESMEAAVPLEHE